MRRLGPRLVRRWVAMYTAGLGPGDRAARQAEMESDLWDQQQEGAPSRQILVRVVRGAGADVAWRIARRQRMQRTNGRVRLPRSASPRSGRPRGPGVAYASLTLALVTIVAAITLSARQAPPPTIAEFAPQAVERISDSSDSAAGSDRGRSADASIAHDEAGADAAAAQPVDVARVRQCVGDPPRQIEDPQSPPCVPYWSGDNGGATSRGVTRDEIRIVVTEDRGRALEAFFNRRFEFYGRQIRFIFHPIAGNPAGNRATARAVAEQDQAFASTDRNGGYTYDYFDELARVGVVAVGMLPMFPESYFRAHHPYVWSYTMANDRLFATVGNWYCARFAGRNAVHAGDPILQASRRKLGIIVTYAGDEGTSPDPMKAELASCGERAESVVLGKYAANDPLSVENAVLQMKTSGVTTVTCLCWTVDVALVMRAATNQGYFPEWHLTTYGASDYNGTIRTWSGNAVEQLEHLMGLTMQPIQRPYPDHPSNWATMEGGNQQATNSFDQLYADMNYQMTLLVASGIQMAGPHLTPATFARGLHRTRFPNPPHRLMAGSVGFDDGDHSMTEDAAEMWWSNFARGPYPDDTSTFCYVDEGARRRIGAFPAGDEPFFREPCYSGA